jgi:RHS repeat-associated protein
MPSVRKYGFETFARLLLTIIVLLNAVIPTTAFAMPPNSEHPSAQQVAETNNSLPSGEPVYYHPSVSIPNPTRFTPQADEASPSAPEKDPVEFSISTSKGEVDSSRTVTINVLIRNHSGATLDNFAYHDKLEDGLGFDASTDELVEYKVSTDTISYEIDSLAAGDEVVFSYTLNIQNNKSGKLSIHNAEIEYDLRGETQTQTASLGFADGSALVDADALIVLPDQSGDGWESAGRYSLYLGDEVLSDEAVVAITPADLSDNGPQLQFNLELIQTTTPATGINSELTEQDISLTQNIESAFDAPAYLEINLDGVADLTDLPAGREPYVATYDEENNVWVKIPIVDEDFSANSVTVAAAHFSTWGAGLVDSLPKNGVNVLLFDQPYTSLFTGASRYSIPIWTPPGRAGIAPDISLSYSSATVDGLLGDVQAPWVGVGWNIDGIEIVRKITTDEKGYGYSNNFALTLNGTVYELLVDPNHTSRYYTKQGSFLYIERHNFAIGNSAGVLNKTGEWWEVVTTDGKRYRLGWNIDSEQLALMYGYGCKTGNPCTTPGGAYQTLGYAGKADDLVALRWRVDRIRDTHGNTITYSYAETQPSAATTLAPFDRESYLSTISYTGFESSPGGPGNLSPGYQVQFVTASRLLAVGDVPTTFNIWDNLDSQYLEKILIKCLLCTPPNQTIRTYYLNYSLAAAPNANGTLKLDNIKITGESFSQNGQTVAAVNAPTMKFTYQNLDNRNIGSTSNDKYAYPRLKSIDNGTGGLLTYTYETDGRGTDSWYDYRVKDVLVNDGTHTAALQTYAYTTPIYTGSGGNANLGDLIGYTSTSEKQIEYNTDAVILETKHDFGTQGLDTGYELKTDWLSGSTLLRRTTNVYVTDNTKAPFSGWNYRYLYQTANYVNSGGSLAAASKVVYLHDPSTGNLIVQTDLLGASPYRKTYYEYLTSPSPSLYILDTASRILVVNASNGVLADSRYSYNAEGDRTIARTLTGSGNQTVDARTHYDPYGNADQASIYTAYGSLDNEPNGDAQNSYVTYDTKFKTYPIAQTNPLGEKSSAAYLYNLGLPYQSTDANGWITKTTYDGLGRQLSIWVPGVDSAAVWYQYPVANANGVVAAPYSVKMQIMDTPANAYRSVWGIYDGLGRQIQMQVFDAASNNILVTDTEFNPQGAVSRQSSPYPVQASGGYYVPPPTPWGQYTSSVYDALGRVTQTIQPGGFKNQTSYDGFTTTSVDPNDQKIERVTDGLGRLTTVREYISTTTTTTLYATTSYANDELNRLVKVTDAQSNITSLTYDWLGRKISMDDPDMDVWTYHYNATGTLDTQTDKLGHVLKFGYDILNRLTSKKDVTSPNAIVALASFEYGGGLEDHGFRTKMTDLSGVTTWGFSNKGRTVLEKRTFDGETSGPTMTTTSDWLGRPLSVIYPDGEVLSYLYDALGRPNQLTSNAPPAPSGLPASLVSLAYNVLGQVTTQTLGNGLVITNTYDTNTNRLFSRIGTNNIINFRYTYDSAGNIKNITDTALSETHDFTYDALNRLQTAKAFTIDHIDQVKYDQEFEYDKVGNITQMNDWVISTATSTATPTATPTSNGMGLPDSTSPHEMFAPISYRSPNLAHSAVINDSFPAISVGHEARADTPENPGIAGLAGWWSLDESSGTRYDAHASNDLADNNTVSSSTGKAGNAAAFVSANSESLSRTDTDSLSSSDFTILTWVKLDSTSGFHALVGKGDSDTASNREYLLYHGNGTIRLNVGDGNGYSATVTATGNPLTAGVWYFVSAWYDSTLNTLNIQINDNTPESTTDLYGSFNSTHPFVIGAKENGTIPMGGLMDETAFYQRVLTASERTWLFNNGNGRTYAEVNSAGRPTPTSTPISTNTSASTPTFTPSITPTSTNTPLLTPTQTRTPTAIVTPTSIPSLTQSLMAYWSFESVSGTTVTDDASNDATTNNATLINGPVIQSSGAQGSSAVFDGVNDYATIADQAEIIKNGSFTISAWIKPASTISTRTQYIVQKGDANKDYGLITASTQQGTATPTASPGRSPSNGSIAFQVGDLTPNTLYGPILPTNAWTMVTGVYDAAAGQMRLYLNGQPVASQTVTGTVSMSTSPLTFSSSSTANVYSGSLDEVRFYNRALSDAEVQTVLDIFAIPTPVSITATSVPATATANITPIPLSQQAWGTGNDGDYTIALNTTFNINTDKSNPNRTCPDGAAFNVIQLGDTAATLDGTLAAACLIAGDEILLIQLAGDSPTGYNAGSYEFLRVSAASGTTVNFSTSKTKWFGSGWRSDSNIGTGTGQIRVMLMRVPNYNTLTVTGTLKANNFDGNKYGVTALRVQGSLLGGGLITVKGLGFVSNQGYGAGGTYNQNGQNPPGGGGGFGTAGSSGSGAGGSVYGTPGLGSMFLGSGGGAEGSYSSNGYPHPGAAGANGGGILWIAGQTLNFSGIINANGDNSIYSSGAGAGGSVHFEGVNITLGTTTANGGTGALGGGSGGQGRIAVYYQSSLSGSTPNPSAYTAIIGQASTATPSPTPISFATPASSGNGGDGDLIINTGSFNLNSDHSNGRTCADGVNYSVLELSSSWARLSEAPTSNCLAVNDEIMLAHLNGTSPNAGHYEFLRVGGIAGSTIYFITPKSNSYGANADDDSGVGGSQTVSLIRVPNYHDVTVAGTLTGSAFDQSKYGVMTFRVSGTLSGTGVITAQGLGFVGNQGSGAGGTYSTAGHNLPGGGGGYGSNGSNGSDEWGGAAGGGVYGTGSLNPIFFGSGGGAAGSYMAGGYPHNGALGARGGGILWIAAQTINFSGTINANGSGSNYNSGAGSGGSIRLEGANITLGSTTVTGGAGALGGGSGGQGRIAVYYYTSLSSSLAANAYTYLQQTTANGSPAPTATPTAVPENPGTGGLVSWWTMNEASGTRNDSNGTNQLTDNNTVGSASGKLGNAGDFVPANTESLSRTDTDTLSASDFTILTWVKLDSTTGYHALVGKGDVNDANNREYLLYHGNGTIRLNVGDGNGHSATVTATGNPLTAGVWYFVAAWYDSASDTLNIQINDNTPESAAYAYGSFNSTHPFVIGAKENGTIPMDGLMDETAIYKRVLTAAERTWLYNNGTGRSYTDVNSSTSVSSGWVQKKYTYSTTIPHAVTYLADGAGSTLATYEYDANGNMTCRMEGTALYKQTYNVENRISSIQKLRSGSCAVPVLETQWDFAYDGDGTRTITLTTIYTTDNHVESSTLTAYYFGGAYEVKGVGEFDDNKFKFTETAPNVKKYYSFGGQTMMRDANGLQYFISDHLGSVVAIAEATDTDSNGSLLISQQRYLPFGGERTNVPILNPSNTDYGYTGQRKLDSEMGGLMDYKARFYSPYITHFSQPDSIVPDLYNPQTLNRYSYALNNPIRYNDPTGHCADPISGTLCFIALGDIAILAGLTVVAVATVYVIVTPHDQVEADMQKLGYAMDKATTKIIRALQAKPLTPDEKKKLGMIDATEGFLKKHPDIASEVIKKALGWKPNKSEGEADHVDEATKWKKGLENAIDQLMGAHRSRDEEAQGVIEGAVEKGKRLLDVLKRKLRGEE